MKFATSVFCAAALAGCASYSWKPETPPEMRTVAVATAVNESSVTELGAVLARETLREFQREGTFSIAPIDECALEVQCVVKDASSSVTAYERRTGARNREREFEAKASVSFIDRKNGRVLVDSRPYAARTTFLANDDTLSGERDASGRLAAELARQIVDDALSLKW